MTKAAAWTGCATKLPKRRRRAPTSGVEGAGGGKGKAACEEAAKGNAVAAYGGEITVRTAIDCEKAAQSEAKKIGSDSYAGCLEAQLEARGRQQRLPQLRRLRQPGQARGRATRMRQPANATLSNSNRVHSCSVFDEFDRATRPLPFLQPRSRREREREIEREREREIERELCALWTPRPSGKTNA